MNIPGFFHSFSHAKSRIASRLSTAGRWLRRWLKEPLLGRPHAIQFQESEEYRTSQRSYLFIYPTGKHTKNDGKSPCLVGETTLNGQFSIAMLVYQRVSSSLLFLFWFHYTSIRLVHLMCVKTQAGATLPGLRYIFGVRWQAWLSTYQLPAKPGWSGHADGSPLARRTFSSGTLLSGRAEGKGCNARGAGRTKYPSIVSEQAMAWCDIA